MALSNENHIHASTLLTGVSQGAYVRGRSVREGTMYLVLPVRVLTSTYIRSTPSGHCIKNNLMDLYYPKRMLCGTTANAHAPRLTLRIGQDTKD